MKFNIIQPNQYKYDVQSLLEMLSRHPSQFNMFLRKGELNERLSETNLTGVNFPQGYTHSRRKLLCCKPRRHSYDFSSEIFSILHSILSTRILHSAYDSPEKCHSLFVFNNNILHIIKLIRIRKVCNILRLYVQKICVLSEKRSQLYVHDIFSN